MLLPLLDGVSVGIDRGLEPAYSLGR
jgi:hypothetical protein